MGNCSKSSSKWRFIRWLLNCHSLLPNACLDIRFKYGEIALKRYYTWKGNVWFRLDKGGSSVRLVWYNWYYNSKYIGYVLKILIKLLIMHLPYVWWTFEKCSKTDPTQLLRITIVKNNSRLFTWFLFEIIMAEFPCVYLQKAFNISWQLVSKPSHQPQSFQIGQRTSEKYRREKNVQGWIIK